MTVKKRQSIERQIVTRILTDAVHQGHEVAVSIDNGVSKVVKPTTDIEKILAGMFSVDDEHLLVYRNGTFCGWVYLVYGNDGWDVINDYTSNLEIVLEGANDLADQIADRS